MTTNQKRFVKLFDELKQLMPVVEAEIIGAFPGGVGAVPKKPKKQIRSDEEIKRIVMKRSFYKK